MDLKEVEYLLHLARIEMNEREKEEISNQLEDILNFVKKLQEIDTEKIEPVSGGTDLLNIFREDKEKERDIEMVNKLKEMAKELSDGYFKIPPIF
jgi:aspartyl-tRNA(Asn)/glutamyl-tRNA(Gln) amidotransferase subunit C